VGVVEDRRSWRVNAEPDIEYFAPIAQAQGAWRAGMVVVRSRQAPGAITASLRRAILEAAPLAVRAEVTPIAERWEEAVRPWRTGSLLFGGLGVLALLVAAVGLYAVVAFGVAQRTREFGIRTALGANAADVVRSVLGEGVRLVAIGVTLGVLIALAAAKLVAALLFGITPRDPLVYVVSAMVLLLSAVVAAWFPARRAAGVDPLVAMRAE
jgi:putative ABC transport system permease protein